MRHAVNWTPSDTIDCPGTEFIYCVSASAASTLRVTTVGGEDVTYTGLATGYPHPIRASRVWSTGTSATGIVLNWT